MNIEELKKQLKDNMTINGVVNERFIHSLGVAEKAVEMNKKLNLGLDEEQVYIAGLLHDAAKLYSKEEQWQIIIKNDTNLDLDDVKTSPPIWHSFAGKYVARDIYHIDDEEILSAIYYHTTGKGNMTTLEKLIFTSDFAEERTRVGDIFDYVRSEFNKSLDRGVLACLSSTINYLNSKKQHIFYLTKEAYDFYKERINNG